MDKIGYMGVAGSFSEMAAEKIVELTGMEAELVPLVSAQNILDALQNGSIAYGLLGVENSTVGPVKEFVDAFDGIGYEMLKEYIMPIHHCLFKKTGVPTGQLKIVASHPHALGQTVRTRADRFPQLAEQVIDDTALGAEWLANGVLPETTAVICSIKAGQAWGLELIAENIEDSTENRTTFWLLKL